MVLEVFGILILSLIIAIFVSHYVFKSIESFKDDEVCKHNKALSLCSECNFGYDFQQDIANYGNGEYDYDYDKDCNISSKYEYDLGAEAELSQEWVSNHTEEKDEVNNA